MTTARPQDRPTATRGAQPIQHVGSVPVATGAWVVLPTYNEAENIRTISAAILEAPARSDAARRRRRLARRHRPDRRRAGRAPTRGSASAIGPRSRGSGGPTSTASALRSPAGPRSSIQMDADWSHDPAALPSLIAPIAGGDGRPRHRVALHGGRRRRRLGHRAADHLPRRQHLRPDRPAARPARPHRRVQGVARVDAGGDPVRRHPRRRLRLPDRDDVPRLAPRGARRRGTDHVPRSARRPVEDEPADRRRGARRRRRRSGRRSSRGRLLGRRGRARSRASRIRRPTSSVWSDRAGDVRVLPAALDDAGGRRGPVTAATHAPLGAPDPGRPAGRGSRRSRRPRRPAAPGARSRAADGVLPRGPARGLRRRAAERASRSPSCSGPTSTTRRSASSDLVRRRPAPPAADPAAALRSADRRSVPALRCVARAPPGGRSEAARPARSTTRSAVRSRSPPGLPLVVTLLDLAPWELPGAYQRGAAARFGQRLRAGCCATPRR